MTADERAELIRRLQLTAVKARANAAEAETVEVAELIDPGLYGTGPLSLITVTERMLRDGRVPEPIDAYNALVLAHRSPGFVLMYELRWEDELPRPAEAHW